MTTRFYTFYTKDTPYEQEARETVEAFKNFGVTCIALPYHNHNDWMVNALSRSELLVQIADQTPADAICMVDADNRPVKPPVRLMYFSGDFGCEDRGKDTKPNRRYSAGVLLFGPSEAGRRVLREWQIKCKMDSSPKMALREQYYLHQVVEEERKNPAFHFVDVGNEYNRKPEDVKPGDNTIMIHYVASRRFLKKIGGKR